VLGHCDSIQLIRVKRPLIPLPTYKRTMVLNEEEQLRIDSAFRMLNDYPFPDSQPFPFTDAERHLNPRVILRAALEYAPTDKGKLNIATTILASDASNQPRNQQLEKDAQEFVKFLLVPSFTITFHS